MYIKIRHADNDEICYATVRMNAAQYQAVREYFHADPADTSRVKMPFGARLVRRGFGWYRLVNYRDTNGARKIDTAAKMLRSFDRKYQADLLAELRTLAAKDLAARATNSGNDGTSGNVRSMQGQKDQSYHPAVRPPSGVASTFMLERLQKHFSKRA